MSTRAPPEIDLESLEHNQRVEAPDGTTYRVLKSHLSDDSYLVEEAVVSYETRLEHPATMGAAGFGALLAALLVPIIIAYAAVVGGVVSSTSGTFAAGVAGMFVGKSAFDWLLYQSAVGVWIDRFDQWWQVKHIAMRGDTA